MNEQLTIQSVMERMSIFKEIDLSQMKKEDVKQIIDSFDKDISELYKNGANPIDNNRELSALEDELEMMKEKMNDNFKPEDEMKNIENDIETLSDFEQTIDETSSFGNSDIEEEPQLEETFFEENKKEEELFSTFEESKTEISEYEKILEENEETIEVNGLKQADFFVYESDEKDEINIVDELPAQNQEFEMLINEEEKLEESYIGEKEILTDIEHSQIIEPIQTIELKDVKIDYKSIAEDVVDKRENITINQALVGGIKAAEGLMDRICIEYGYVPEQHIMPAQELETYVTDYERDDR